MYRSHKKFSISWLRTMISGLINLSQGLLILCSLGLISPMWDIIYVSHCSIKDMKKHIEDEKKVLTIKNK